MLGIDYKRKYLKDEVVNKMVVLAVKKFDNFNYWFHVRDHQKLPDDGEYDIILTKA